MGRTEGSNKGEKLIRVRARVAPNAQVFHGTGRLVARARGIFQNARTFARYKSAHIVDGHRPPQRGGVKLTRVRTQKNMLFTQRGRIADTG